MDLTIMDLTNLSEPYIERLIKFLDELNDDKENIVMSAQSEILLENEEFIRSIKRINYTINIDHEDNFIQVVNDYLLALNDFFLNDSTKIFLPIEDLVQIKEQLKVRMKYAQVKPEYFYPLQKEYNNFRLNPCWNGLFECHLKFTHVPYYKQFEQLDTIILKKNT